MLVSFLFATCSSHPRCMMRGAAMRGWADGPDRASIARWNRARTPFVPRRVGWAAIGATWRRG